MSTPKIGLALYTIRDKMKTPVDYARCLKKVKEIGYEGVEGDAIDPIVDAAEYAKMLKGEGLVCCSNHAREADLRGRLDAVIARARTIGCSALGYPWLEEKYWNEQGARAIASFLNETGAKLRNEGILFLYHNHAVEFNRIGNKTILQLIYELTDPQNVWAQLDTYWVQHGGADPVDWINRVKGRMRHLHCKDKAMLGEESVFAEVGEGNLDWPRIVKAARKTGVEWLIVEQDSSRRDTLESAAMSFKALRAALG